MTLTATAANGVKTTAAHVVTVQPGPPACPVQSDEFSGNALDPKWEVLRPSATALDVSGGNLRLTPFGGDMHGTNANVRNLLLQTMPSGAWTATAKIDVSQLTATGDQTGLVVWRGEGPNNFAKVVFNRRQTAPDANYWVERQNNIDGVTQAGGGDAGTLSNPPAGGVYIRVQSDGAARTRRSARRTRSTAPTGSRSGTRSSSAAAGRSRSARRTGARPPRTVASVDWFRVTSATAAWTTRRRRPPGTRSRRRRRTAPAAGTRARRR